MTRTCLGSNIDSLASVVRIIYQAPKFFRTSNNQMKICNLDLIRVLGQTKQDPNFHRTPSDFGKGLENPQNLGLKNGGHFINMSESGSKKTNLRLRPRL